MRFVNRDQSPFTCAQTCEITTDPSPTAEATRLTDPARTSPTAKMPGAEVWKPGLRAPASGPGQDEALVVERDEAREPAGVGRGPHHDEDRPRVDAPVLPASRVADRHRLEPVVAVERVIWRV
jgi:hypothetical protein